MVQMSMQTDKSDGIKDTNCSCNHSNSTDSKSGECSIDHSVEQCIEQCVEQCVNQVSDNRNEKSKLSIVVLDDMEDEPNQNVTGNENVVCNDNAICDVDVDENVDKEEDEHFDNYTKNVLEDGHTNEKDNKKVRILPRDQVNKIKVDKKYESVKIAEPVRKQRDYSYNSNYNNSNYNTDYMLELKVPIHLCQNRLSNSSFDGIVTEAPFCNVKKITKDVHPTLSLSVEEFRLYNQLTISKDSNHEKRIVNNEVCNIEEDRIKFITKSFTNLFCTALKAHDCLYGLCTLKRLNSICRYIVIGKKYMFLFRINTDLTKYVIFTIKSKDVVKTKTFSGLVQKTYTMTLEDNSTILCKTYTKRENGAVHQSDTLLNQIEFNFSTYIKITGDMILMSTTIDGTRSYNLNEIFILTM